MTLLRPQDRSGFLSPQEVQVLNHLVQGRSREATARRIDRSKRHVHRITQSIRIKLQVSNDLQMAIVADRLGLIDPSVFPGHVEPRGPYAARPPRRPATSIPLPPMGPWPDPSRDTGADPCRGFPLGGAAFRDGSVAARNDEGPAGAAED